MRFYTWYDLVRALSIYLDKWIVGGEYCLSQAKDLTSALTPTPHIQKFSLYLSCVVVCLHLLLIFFSGRRRIIHRHDIVYYFPCCLGESCHNHIHLLLWQFIYRRGFGHYINSYTCYSFFFSGTFTAEAVISVLATRELLDASFSCHAHTPRHPHVEGTPLLQGRTSSVSLNITCKWYKTQ